MVFMLIDVLFKDVLQLKILIGNEFRSISIRYLGDY